MTSVARANNAPAITSGMNPGSAAAKRRAAMAEAASGKLVAHQEMRNGQQSGRFRNCPTSTASMNSVSV